jgi:hypothetical protein
VNLDQKLLVDPAAMTPKAASYFRRRPYLTPEVCKRWRMGYLGRDAGGDRAGGTMRGKVIYAYQSEEGEVLTWFGRDPEHEDKHRQWLATGKQGSEPEKFHFVKGFHRGLELFGQDRFVAEMRRREAEGEGVEQSPLLPTGLIVVEGPNDVIRMGTLGEPAVGLCSNTVTREQAVKIARLSAAYAGGHVALMLDCDSEGENGARQALWEITQHGAAVRLVWSRGMHGGRFADRQPESCSPEEWAELRQAL